MSFAALGAAQHVFQHTLQQITFPFHVTTFLWYWELFQDGFVGWSLGKGILPSASSLPTLTSSVRVFRYLSASQGRFLEPKLQDTSRSAFNIDLGKNMQK